MYIFITNPNARSGLGAKVWHQIEPVLKERDISYEVHFTRYRQHATAIVRDITSDGQEHTLIVLGGDGTVNEVMNGIADYALVTLGYIPIGSSNDFARYFHFPKNPLKALEIVLSPSRFHHINVGLLTYPGKKRCFAVSTGIGFDAGVCHEAVISKLKVFLNKLKLGKLTYAGIAVHQLVSLKPGWMTVTLDNRDKTTFHRAYFAAAMNHPYEGGGFKFCPEADPCDDKLDIIVVADVPKIKAFLLLPTAFAGWHVHFKGIYTFTCRMADIESEKALPVHTDGEPVYLQHHIQASLAPGEIRLITG